MRETTEIRIQEHVNGYTVTGSVDFKYFLDEIQEERLEALKSVERWIRDEIIRELERRQQHAGQS